MPHHYTKNTVSDTFWCGKCGRPTLHQVLGGRRGACIACMEKLEAEGVERKAEKPAPVQANLFGGSS